VAAFNRPLATLLGSSRRYSRAPSTAILAGNAVLKAAAPSRRHAGRSSSATTALGDGRAILLGEQIRHPAIAWTFS
jgi:hypothetical protein